MLRFIRSNQTKLEHIKADHAMTDCIATKYPVLLCAL